MKSFTFSRLYAASLIGLGAVAVVVACDPGTDMPGTQLDMSATSDMTTVSDMTMFDAPTVTAVSPAVGANNATTNVTITGSNFRAGATVTVAGAACGNVMVVSPTSITCTVAAKAATCGPQDIVVTHPDDGKSGTGTRLFTYRTSGATSWANLVSYSTGTGPRRVLIADFNADNKLDLLTVNSAGNNLTLKTGLGDGTFPNGASQNIAIGNGATGPSDLAMGDFNGDNKPDIVTVNNSGNISVLANQGGTAFTPTVITTTGFVGGTGGSIAVGDITGDNRPDLVLGSSNTLNVLPMISQGTGQFTVGTMRAVGGVVSDIALADMNKDGKLDIVTANSSTNSVTVSLANGSGTFGNPLNQNVGTSPSGLIVIDLDGDKSLDVVASNDQSMNVSVLKGQGTGLLDPAVNQSLGTNRPASLWVADVNGDGKPDIVTANSASNTWSYLQGMTPTSYAPHATANAGAGPSDVAVADLNGDGLQDIVLVSSGTNNVQVALQVCK